MFSHPASCLRLRSSVALSLRKLMERRDTKTRRLNRCFKCTCQGLTWRTFVDRCRTRRELVFKSRTPHKGEGLSSSCNTSTRFQSFTAAMLQARVRLTRLATCSRWKLRCLPPDTYGPQTQFFTSATEAAEPVMLYQAYSPYNHVRVVEVR